MIPHNAEILQAEMELPLRLCDEGEEKRLEPRLKKAHVVMVNFRRDIVRRRLAKNVLVSDTTWGSSLAFTAGASCKRCIMDEVRSV
ncbi:MAG: hypothetical protein LBL45_02405 [Treponema sp.]|nr:hypothetical protein [Treponema sp.]